MACRISERAENILGEIKKCPNYLRRMEYTMLSLKAILKDAEKHEYSHHQSNWLNELQNVFTQIEGFLEEFKEKVCKQEAIGKQVFVSSSYSCQNEQKMKKLCDDLDEIASQMYKFNLTNMETTNSFLSATEVSTRLMKPSWQLLYPLINAPKAFHNNRYGDYLNHFITSTHGFFHIVGEAGIGKNTLAKFLYNNKKVEDMFKSRLWVCVKEEFNTQRLIKEMLSYSYCQATCDNLTEKQLSLTVQQFLKDKTFLLVFQDISIKNVDNCSMFKSLLGMGNSDSKIIMTTQNEDIAKAMKLVNIYMSKSQVVPSQEAKQPSNINNDKAHTKNMTHQTIFKVERLSKENSMNLFNAQEAQSSNLTQIEELIEQKCHGFPLAIKCLSGLLSSKTSIAEWNSVIDKLKAQEAGEDRSILPTLRFCYDLMPSHLQSCFLHCSQFTKDRILSSNDVIQLWIAHDLLPKESNLSLEKIGENYLKELRSRCFLQELEEYGLGYWFKLHPLIQKLANIITQEQVCQKQVTEFKSISFTVRDKVPPSAFLAETCIQKFNFLKLLYLGNANLKEIPKAVGTLKQLRYLDLQGNKRIKRLPNSICNLPNLQTLILAACSALEELPNEIRKLIKLRYLWVTADKLHLQKKGIGTMTSLRFLAIGGCDNLQDLFEQPSCLVRLETLMIYDCKTLKQLPDGIGSLISLQNLVIWSCKQLTLTLKGVEFKLRRFTIRELPTVNILPEWIQRFTETLRVLEIIDCPIEYKPHMFKSYKALERISIHGDVRFKKTDDLVHVEFKNSVSRRKIQKEPKTYN